MDDLTISGYDEFVEEISTLISTYPPPFIYVYDPIALRTTNTVLAKTISDIAVDDAEIHLVRVDAGTCFAQRLFFDAVINTLLDDTASEERWDDSWDSFIHGLRHIHTARKRDQGQKDVRFVISVENAHRLKEKLPDSIIPLSRLSELVSISFLSTVCNLIMTMQSRIDITVILLSQTQWQDLKPPLGASPDPYYIDIKPLTKSGTSPLSTFTSLSTHIIRTSDIITTLSSRYTSLSSQHNSSKSKYSHCYHPSLTNLYTHYISMICEVCFPFVHDIDELAYIAAARWPGFIKPLLHTSSPDSEGDTEIIVNPPSEDTRLRLIRAFTPTITRALEELYPRLTNAMDWADMNEPPDDVLSQLSSSRLIHSPAGHLNSPMKVNNRQTDVSSLVDLPRMSKFILVASYIASTNPPKSDLRMFGRGLDEKKRKRRNVSRVSKTKGPSKVSLFSFSSLWNF
jgi:origin recognition complex subunit 5